ncbi:hypothetical protein Egran_02993 [Elaphomyces granulatus]|uniref:Sigma-70 region 2 family protein n=1 Tax=Elaphomyces granulatus TaxID=519963 RepID=A0A232LZJ7_9EURO|nr:hypothetical protein Egran_02993 [Elaphomyces granulatus]
MSNPTGTRSVGGGASKTGQRQWQFIDASRDSATNLTQVKRHVMQEYMRQKRQDTQNRDGNGDGDRGPQRPTQKRRPRQKKPQPPKPAGMPSARTQGDKNLEDRPAGGSELLGSQEPEIQDAQVDDDVEEIIRPFPPGTCLERADMFSVRNDLSLPYRDFAEADVFPSLPSFPHPLDQASNSDVSSSFTPFSGFNSDSPDLGSLSSWSSVASPLMHSPPQTILSAARTDPFESLPLQLSPEDKRLFDFYVNEMPACSYGSHFRSKRAHNWYTEVFVPEGMKGAVTFVNTILVHAANTWAWVRNEEETQDTLVYRGRAISMLNQHLLENQYDISDVAITACMSAAALEDFDPRPGHKEISWIHMRAARQMIRNRGGPVAFENTKLAMLINWQDYILAGYETHGPSFYFEHDPSFPPIAAELFPSVLSQLPSPPCSEPSVSPGRTRSPSPRASSRGRFPLNPRQEVMLQCEELINFLKRCEQLALNRQGSVSEALAPTLHSSFQKNSMLYQILASPASERFTPSGNRKQFVARLASLMMLNAAFWDYRSSIFRTETFLSNLIFKMLDSEVDTSGSLEALLQILLSCKDGIDESQIDLLSMPLVPGSSPENRQTPDFSQYSPTATSPFARPWFVGRMLKISKRLCFESWMHVNEILFSCLTLQIQNPQVPSWENELRREIMAAPLTSYVMPSLERC